MRVDLYDRDEERRQQSLCVLVEGEHEWHCIDNYGRPTGEQLCMSCWNKPDCPTGREHPDPKHIAWHFERHKKNATLW